MKREEYNERCRSMENEIAIQTIKIQRMVDFDYGTFIYIGTPAQKAQARQQWEESKKRAVERQLQYIQQIAELSFFGSEGREETLKSVEQAEAEMNSLIRSHSGIPDTLINFSEN